MGKSMKEKKKKKISRFIDKYLYLSIYLV